MKGVDYAWYRPSDAWLRDYGFVCRYLSWLPNGKVLTGDEYRHLATLGKKVVLNWEYDAQDQLRGYDGGVKDATEAKRQIATLGIHGPCAVYFSADWDASSVDYTNCIKPYLRGAGSVLGGSRCVGVYGSYHTVMRAMQDNVAYYGWQTYAWSGGLWYGPAQIHQVQNTPQYDIDYSYDADFGYVGSIGTVPLTPFPPPSSYDIAQQENDMHFSAEELRSGVVFLSPAATIGRKTYIRATADYAPATLRVAYWNDKGELAPIRQVTVPIGRDVDIIGLPSGGPYGHDQVRTVSVQLVTPGNSVGLDVSVSITPV